MPLLVARQIAHAYRRPFGSRLTSLVDVDLQLDPGQCWGLVGPNGSGKSTLLRILAGLALPHAGEVTILGRAAGSRSARAATGYAPETLSWPPGLRVVDALGELAALSSVRSVGVRIERVAGLLGLLPLLRRRLGSLSLGQSRRVVVAQALLDDPPVLLLDEAFSGLDSLVVRDLRDDLVRRVAEGAGAVLASHRLEDLRGLCTHVLVLREGRVVLRGTADEVLAGIEEREGLATLLGAPA